MLMRAQFKRLGKDFFVLQYSLSVFAKNRLLECCPTTAKNNHQRVCPKKGHCVTGNVWRTLNREFLDKVYNMSLIDFIKYKHTE
jgi:DNA-binding IscR family transcriptional regulator